MQWVIEERSCNLEKARQMLKKGPFSKICLTCWTVSWSILDLPIYLHEQDYFCPRKNASILWYPCDTTNIYRVPTSLSIVLASMIRIDGIQAISRSFLEHWTSLKKFGNWGTISGWSLRKNEISTALLLRNIQFIMWISANDVKRFSGTIWKFTIAF